ncbi:MAG: alanine dehydrogenase [Oscillospiraceae bacterium]|nr:alanine dehydrogenase [Oscillospiraceae bacterium]
MIIGVPKEIKNSENRIALTPAGAFDLVNLGHRVIVEDSGGLGVSATNDDYIAVGAEITDKKALFETADLIVKVKEPLKEEYKYFREGQYLFTFLHVAADQELGEFLVKKKITSIAYETVTGEGNSLPLLAPMSEVAGRISTQVGAALLQKNNGGLGVLLGGVPGVPPAEVVIIGGGNVGTNAAKIACGMGARVTILDVSKKRLVYLDEVFEGRLTTLLSNSFNIAESVKKADLLIGAVLIPGAKAPKLVTEDMVKTMKKGSVIVDVAIDQGGCIETIDRVTTHENPYYEKHGVLHYSVANMPGTVPITSTYALTGITLPYIKRLVSDDFIDVLLKDEDLLNGLTSHNGHCTNYEVAQALGLKYTKAREALES